MQSFSTYTLTGLDMCIHLRLRRHIHSANPIHHPQKGPVLFVIFVFCLFVLLVICFAFFGKNI